MGTVTTLTYNSSGLKGCLEQIVENLRDAKQTVSDMKQTVLECEDGVNSMKQKVANNTKDIEQGAKCQLIHTEQIEELQNKLK